VVTGVGSEAERTLATLHLHQLRDTQVAEMVSAARDSLWIMWYQLHMRVEGCNTGFNLVGESILTCGPEGQWSGNPPVCEGKHVTLTG
jgi:hypothetical protein